MNEKRHYDIYFELFGKKMKTKVEASSASQAIEVLKSKIIIHKAEPSADSYNKIMDIFDDIFNELKTK